MLNLTGIDTFQVLMCLTAVLQAMCNSLDVCLWASKCLDALFQKVLHSSLSNLHFVVNALFKLNM